MQGVDKIIFMDIFKNTDKLNNERRKIMKSFKKFFAKLNNGETEQTRIKIGEENEKKELLKRLRYLKEKADSKKNRK